MIVCSYRAAGRLMARKLVDCIRKPETENKHERCVQHGSRGFLTKTVAGQKTELLALSEEAVPSPDGEPLCPELAGGQGAKPAQISKGLVGRYVELYDFFDRPLEVRWKGVPFPYRVFSKDQHVTHTAIVENKRLSHALTIV